ncbi:hypothetical protein [Acidianus sp. HS-5]|uniref:hypothetical protein n=1 Tax=Acidianus sp. HS-5 TaxID=2886040 RepID=UPI001F18C074|nr:hypothetical protein [Acidianus sp. HS-5]BDC18623.1 hypothetical protein HS5_15130 [Acidianus sp. HS-5]
MQKIYSVIGSVLISISFLLNILGIITSAIGIYLVTSYIRSLYVEYKREKELGKFLYLAMTMLFLSFLVFSVGMYSAFGLKEFFVVLPPSSVFSLAIMVYTYVISGIFYIVSAVYLIKSVSPLTVFTKVKSVSYSIYLMGISAVLLFSIVAAPGGVILSLIAWIWFAINLYLTG